jgi:UDP-glucose 4-epimerase
MKEKNGSPEQAYKAANVDLSERLLSAAKSGGASQMIFMSTVKVNGEGGEQTYHAEDQPIPEGYYANSKLMAEQRLLEGSGEELSVSILRLPLVYGPGVKGNLALLDRVIQKGISLPFAGFSNKRDMISLGNLASIVDFFIKQPPETSRVWMVSDNCGLSTAALCQAMARAKGQPLKLFWLPAPLLRLLLKITGKQGMFDRLFGSFKVDIKPLLDAGWKPVQTPEEGFMEMYRGK